jgi:hypothetical protein
MQVPANGSADHGTRARRAVDGVASKKSRDVLLSQPRHADGAAAETIDQERAHAMPRNLACRLSQTAHMLLVVPKAPQLLGDTWRIDGASGPEQSFPAQKTEKDPQCRSDRVRPSLSQRSATARGQVLREEAFDQFLIESRQRYLVRRHPVSEMSDGVAVHVERALGISTLPDIANESFDVGLQLAGTQPSRDVQLVRSHRASHGGALLPGRNNARRRTLLIMHGNLDPKAARYTAKPRTPTRPPCRTPHNHRPRIIAVMHGHA